MQHRTKDVMRGQKSHCVKIKHAFLGTNVIVDKREEKYVTFPWNLDASVAVLVKLVQLIKTIHNICKVRGLNPDTKK